MKSWYLSFPAGIVLLTLMIFAWKPAVAGFQKPAYMDAQPPELQGGIWLNTSNKTPVKLASRKGKVTLVHFWTFGCINCKRNLPTYNRWQKQFEKQGVMVIGVHTPETEYERDIKNVEASLKKADITYPVLVDSEGANWNRWGQQIWPTVYLLDKWGHVRYRWIGELEYKNAGGEAKTTKYIEELLKEKYPG